MITPNALRSFAALLALTAISSSSVFAAETHGYLRTGIGSSQGGADQACFQAPGAEAKARLGNECDTYIELTIAEQFKNSDAGTGKFRGALTLALSSGQNKDWESTSATSARVDGETSNFNISQELTLALREAYVEASQIFGDDPKLWIGKRFYRRHDVHMLDYYFLNNSGPGAGVEDIAVGSAKLHVAITRNTPAPSSDAPAQTNIDLRLSDIPFFTGTLQPVVIYGTQAKTANKTGKRNYQAMSGTQVGVLYNQPTPIGNNLFVVQYGIGLFGANRNGGGSALNDFGASGSQAVPDGDSDAKREQEDSSTLRLIEHLAFAPMESLNGEFVILYQDVDFGGHRNTIGGTTLPDSDEIAGGTSVAVPNKKELTVGIRPIYHFTSNYALAFEAAHTSVKNAVTVGDEYKDATLQKYTLAPTITPNVEYWSRPQLRLFATYAKWNKDSKGQVGSGTALADNSEGFSAGAQVEAWW